MFFNFKDPVEDDVINNDPDEFLGIEVEMDDDVEIDPDTFDADDYDDAAPSVDEAAVAGANADEHTKSLAAKEYEAASAHQDVDDDDEPDITLED